MIGGALHERLRHRRRTAPSGSWSCMWQGSAVLKVACNPHVQGVVLVLDTKCSKGSKALGNLQGIIQEPSPTASHMARRTDERCQRTCQTYRQTLPTQPVETRHYAGLRSSPRSRSCARRHHSWARGIGSSARLESVAHVENTVMDVYYRNDSMKSERRIVRRLFH
jgi:hypothetical protein